MSEMMHNTDIAVIGGGASGLFAAIAAAREALKLNKKVRISIFEANSRVGKKILVTGNGRCNFTNENIALSNFHGESDFAYKVYCDFDNGKTLDFFRSIALFPKSDFAGRIYPLSNQATAVLDALRCEASTLGITEITDTKITSLEKSGKDFVLNGSIKANVCILTTGGKAAPVQGSDGSGFSLLKKFGVYVTELYPALTPLVCESFPKSLKGIRAQGKISIRHQGKVLCEDTGEIQYTEYGLSGIPSMQVSRFVSQALAQNKGDVVAAVDSCPSFTPQELDEILNSLIKRNSTMTGELLLAGLLPKRLGMTLLADCSINPSKEIGKIHPAVVEKITAAVKNKKYKVCSVKGFNDAQVTTGGIPAAEIDCNTLELKKVRGMFVAGEIIDVDGDCGGYNLQWAWSSGYKAGINAVREI